MLFINTLEKVRLYLMAKPVLTKDEKELLIQIREELEHFPRGTIHRDDLVEYGYDTQLMSCADMAVLAEKIREDSWEQLSKEQVPVIAGAAGAPVSICPLCDEPAAFDQETMFCWCEYPECKLSWSYMKFAYVGYSALTGFFIDNNIGYRVLEKEETPMYIPITEYRKYFSAQACKEQFFHILRPYDPALIIELGDRGYTTDKVKNRDALDKYGQDAWWVSCYKEGEGEEEENE